MKQDKAVETSAGSIIASLNHADNWGEDGKMFMAMNLYFSKDGVAKTVKHLVTEGTARKAHGLDKLSESQRAGVIAKLLSGGEFEQKAKQHFPQQDQVKVAVHHCLKGAQGIKHWPDQGKKWAAKCLAGKDGAKQVAAGLIEHSSKDGNELWLKSPWEKEQAVAALTADPEFERRLRAGLDLSGGAEAASSSSQGDKKKKERRQSDSPKDEAAAAGGSPQVQVWLPIPTELVKGTLLDKITTFEEFELSFDIVPTSKRNGWANIIHFSSQDSDKSRIPAIFFHPKTTRLHVRMGREGAHNDGLDSKEELPLGETTHLTVRLQGSEFMFLMGDRKQSKQGYDSKIPGCSNVKVYAPDCWYEAAAARVSNLRYGPLGHAPAPASPQEADAHPAFASPPDDWQLLVEQITKDEAAQLQVHLQIKFNGRNVVRDVPAGEAREILRRMYAPAERKPGGQAAERPPGGGPPPGGGGGAKPDHGQKAPAAKQTKSDGGVVGVTQAGQVEVPGLVHAPGPEAKVEIPTNPGTRRSPVLSSVSKAAASVVAGAGIPTDPLLHEIPEVETSVKIDEKCAVAKDVQKEIQFEKGVPVANAVIYEGAAVSAKIRNALSVGGERPNALHLFVEEVQTPTVQMLVAPKREGTVGGRPGENVSDLTPLSLHKTVEEAGRLTVKWNETAFELLVEEGLLDSIAPVLDSGGRPIVGDASPSKGGRGSLEAEKKGSVRVLEPMVAAYAWIMSFHIRLCCEEVLGHKGPLPTLICMPTICADMGVAMKDKSGQVIVNLLAFQQSECCAVSQAQWMTFGEGYWVPYDGDLNRRIEEAHQNGDAEVNFQRGKHRYVVNFAKSVQVNKATKKERAVRREDSMPESLKRQEFKRQLLYWVQRIAMAQDGNGPTGLYNKDVRERFKKVVQRAVAEGRA